MKKVLQGRKDILLWDMRLLWPALYLTMQAWYAYQPWKPVAITDFDRIIGQATLYNISISARTGRMLLFFVVLLPATVLAFWTLFSLALGGKKCADPAHPLHQQQESLLHLLGALGGVGLLALLPPYFRDFGGEAGQLPTFRAAHLFPLVAVVLLTVWAAVRMHRRPEENAADPEHVWLALLIGLVCAFPLQLCIAFNVYGCAVGAVVMLLVTCGICSMAKRRPRERFDPLLTTLSLPLLAMLPLCLIYLELRNILNRFGVYWGNSFFPLLIILLLCVKCAVILHDVCVKWPERAVRMDWKRLWYPGVIVSLALVARQPGLQSFIYTDFFEQANKAVSISGFLRFGQIPAVETHGAHMFSDYIGNIFWGIINGDALSASFLSYSGIPLALTSLLFYYLLSKCIDRDTAFITTLLLPVMNISPGDWYCHLSYLPVLVLVWLLQDKQPKRYVWFWLSAAFSVLYRGDTGLAVGGGALLVLLIHTAFQKDRTQWKRFALSGLACGGGLGCFFALLCVVKGINPFLRLREFIEVMALSNQDWAYSTIGEAGKSGIAWTFFITPVLLVTLLVTVLVRRARAKGETPEAGYWMFLSFAVGYFINFPRTLVRHSLTEQIPIYCLAMGVWAIALGVWLLWRGRERRRTGRILLPALLLAVLSLTGAVFDTRILCATDLLNIAYDNFDKGQMRDYQLVTSSGGVSYEKKIKKTVPRGVISSEMTNRYRNLQELLDGLLEEDETYLDFTNQTALYALLGRRSPVYVNQSPALLSGEFSQKMFIREIERQADKVPVALLPQQNMTLAFNLDGVQNTLRYYRVSEYIYNNYVPYAVADGFAVWVRPERVSGGEKGEMEQQIVTLQPDYTQVESKNAALEAGKDQLKITATADDPMVLKFQRLFSGYTGEDGNVRLSITYTSDKSGTAQVFYARKGMGFSEQESVRVPVDATSVPTAMEVVIPWTVGCSLRLDTPDDAVFTISGISVEPISGPVGCGYEYAAHDLAHCYEMGDTALLWGEYDKADAKHNPVIGTLKSETTNTELKLRPLYGLSEEQTGGEKGRYIRLKIKSPVDGDGWLYLMQGDTRQLADFHFNIKQGEYTYLIRVSCDSYWYSGMTDGLTYKLGLGARLMGFDVLDGD